MENGAGPQRGFSGLSPKAGSTLSCGIIGGNMFLFGWGHRRTPLGRAGSRDCHVCQASRPVQADLEYRYFHIFWLFGAILTRRYHFKCSRCGREFEARSHRLKGVVKEENARFISFGPVFLIIRGGALLLIGPGDYSD
jgi:hypothetical protein